MARIPAFKGGVLPPGEYSVTLDDIETSYLVTGRGLNDAEWNPVRRSRLMTSLRAVCGLLTQTGMVSDLFVDGSFVERVGAPSDVDCYFLLRDPDDWDEGRFQAALQHLDPEGGWTWDPDDVVPCGAKTKKPPFWRRYRVDLFPELGDPCGIAGRNKRELTFAEAFRQRTVTGTPKGILRIELS